MKLLPVNYYQAEGDANYGSLPSLAQPLYWRIDLSQWLTERGISWDGDLSNLHTLDLSNKQLTSIPESIGQLTHLHSLSLSYNDLTSIPKWIFQGKGCVSSRLNANAKGQLTNLRYLNLRVNRLTSIPESIGQLTNLHTLSLRSNQLTSIPESIGQLTNLHTLDLRSNQLTSIPESIGQLTNLRELYLSNNQLTSIPESIGQLTNLHILDFRGNQLTDLSPLQRLTQKNLEVQCFNVYLPRRYWTKFSDWQPEWLLDENNAEIRRIIIQQVGYEKICDRFEAVVLDTWREYTLLIISDIEPVYEVGNDKPIYWESLVLLKMTCPSTKHIHILRVPPSMNSAELTITWVNHGIHPDRFSVQT